jgi:cellulose synthase/poly-beta-1,6-N-acetylglucosamine synthase-like glycosyltransferase
MATFYEKYSPAFIAAPVDCSSPSLKKENGQWRRALYIFQALDFMALQGITGAGVYKKFHCMCNGANLAYEKKVFYEVGGYEGIDSIASGDDMLLMHKIYEKYPNRISFLKSANTTVKTKPVKTLMDFFHQRIRWASKADKYTDKKITGVLIFVYLFNVWILLLCILSFVYHTIFYCFIALLFAKIICELFFLYPVAKFFNKEKLLWWFPLAQPFHIVYTIIVGWLGKFGSFKWKERKVR